MLVMVLGMVELARRLCYMWQLASNKVDLNPSINRGGLCKVKSSFFLLQGSAFWMINVTLNQFII